MKAARWYPPAPAIPLRLSAAAERQADALRQSYAAHVADWMLARLRASLRRSNPMGAYVSLQDLHDSGQPYAGPDHGADGPAASRRRVELIPADDAGQTYAEVQDCDWLDVLTSGNVITARGRDALRHLRDQYTTARPPGAAASGFASRGKCATWGVVDQEAWDEYRRLIGALPPDTREPVRTVAVDEEWPRAGNAARLVKQGSERLADVLGLAP